MRKPMSTARAAIITAAIIGIGGCGDPLVEGDYRGQALFELSGTIRVMDSVAQDRAGDVRVGLLWVGAAEHGDLTQGRSESSFPARYSMQVFTNPPGRAMQKTPDSDGAHGVARIVLYVDEDGDERLDPLEPLVGAAPNDVLAFFTDSQPSSIVRGSILNGYQIMHLVPCENRLVDKAWFEPTASANEVDLTLATTATDSLLDIDCDTVADDLCFDLRLQVQDDPTNDELVALYENRCDVDFDPVFERNNDVQEAPTNNTPDEEPKNNENPDANAEPNSTPEQNCDTNPERPECREPDGPTAEQVILECKPLLGDAIGTSYDDQREAYRRFSQCTEEFDPCKALGWDGSAEGWQDYQLCTFEMLPPHHQDWCRDLFERLEITEGEDREFLEAELLRGECQD